MSVRERDDVLLMFQKETNQRNNTSNKILWRRRLVEGCAGIFEQFMECDSVYQMEKAPVF